MRLFPNSLNHHPGLWRMKKDSGSGCIYGWVFNGVSEVQGLKMFFGISWKSKALSHYITELNSLAMGLCKYFFLPFLFREVDNLKLPGPPKHTEYPGQAPGLGSHGDPSLCQAGVAQGTDWGGWNQGRSDVILSWNSRFLPELVPSQKAAAEWGDCRGRRWCGRRSRHRAVPWDASWDSEPLPRADITPCPPCPPWAAQPRVPGSAPAAGWRKAQFTLQCTSTLCQKGHHCFV